MMTVQTVSREEIERMEDIRRDSRQLVTRSPVQPAPIEVSYTPNVCGHDGGMVEVFGLPLMHIHDEDDYGETFDMVILTPDEAIRLAQALVKVAGKAKAA